MILSTTVRQAFFNSILLLIVFVRSQAQLYGDEHSQGQAARKEDGVSMTESFDSAQKSQVLAEFSPATGNSPRRNRSIDKDKSNKSSHLSGQNLSEYQPRMEYPKCKEFLQEMKHTTAVMDLLDRLEKKDESVEYFERCLKIVEQQKHDWFENLIEMQANEIRAGLRHFAKDVRGSPTLQEISLRDAVSAYEESMKDKMSVSCISFNGSFLDTDLLTISLGDLFRIQKKLVSKEMRKQLYQSMLTNT